MKNLMSYQTKPAKDPNDYDEFLDLQSAIEVFDLASLLHTGTIWYGREDTSCRDQILVPLDANRWVLCFVVIPDDNEAGSHPETGPPHRELPSDDASRWLMENRYELPPGLRPVSPRKAKRAQIETDRLSHDWKPPQVSEPTEAAGSPPSGSRKGAKPPPTEAFEAYKYSEFLGYKQQRIAQVLTAELRRPINQGQVSRFIKKVRLWLQEGNPMPSPCTTTATVAAFDPRKIDMGPRSDGRVSRQRQRSED